MTELKEIIELIKRMGCIDRLDAKIDGWDISLYTYDGTRHFNMEIEIEEEENDV